MKHTELRKTCETYLEDLISEVKSESASEVLHDYFDFCARFHSYSFRNTLLIWMVRPDATRVAGFATWQKLGRFIKKGEKGIPIFAPMRIKKKQETGFVEDLAEEEEITLFKLQSCTEDDILKRIGWTGEVPTFMVRFHKRRARPVIRDYIFLDRERFGDLPGIKERQKALGVRKATCIGTSKGS